MRGSRRIISIILPFVCLTVLLSASDRADAEKIEKAVFGVCRSDTGQQTLEKMTGVKKVYTGFRDFLEITTVYYDPDVISVRELEDALKEAGLYRETVHDIQME